MGVYHKKWSKPDLVMEDSKMPLTKTPLYAWTFYPTLHPFNELDKKIFFYMDRIRPDVFVGRFDYGKCSNYEENCENPDYYVNLPYKRSKNNPLDPRDIPPLHKKHYRMHSYTVTVTPEKVSCTCLRCWTEMGMHPWFRAKNVYWDDPWTEPRRATERELKSMNATSPPAGKQLFLDQVSESCNSGRVRVGKCPKGGEHEACIYFCAHPDMVSIHPVYSHCVFCREQWDGAPPGYYDAYRKTGYLKSNNQTVEEYMEDYYVDLENGEI